MPRETVVGGGRGKGSKDQRSHGGGGGGGGAGGGGSKDLACPGKTGGRIRLAYSRNLRFADDIDGLAGQEQELGKLVNHIEEASAAYGMQISAEKTQLMTNNTNGISTDITIDNKKLETIRSFEYLGAIVSDEGSKPELLSRIAQTTAALTKPTVIWNNKNIVISSKIRLMRSLAMSIFL